MKTSQSRLDRNHCCKKLGSYILAAKIDAIKLGETFGMFYSNIVYAKNVS
jgi:hypothetical protein